LLHPSSNGSTPAKTGATAVAAPSVPAPSKAVPEKVAAKVPAAPTVPKAIDEAETSERAPGRLLWMIGAVALVLIIVVTARMLRHSPQPQPQASVAQVPQQNTPQVSPPAAVAPKKPAAARSATPVPARVAAPVVPASVSATNSATGGEAWRVVAFTYNHQDQAQHKAQTIVSRHPELQAGVFSPRGNGAPYLVTLGGPMNRDAAVQLRDKAIRAGLPHDTYVQNYSH